MAEGESSMTKFLSTTVEAPRTAVNSLLWAVRASGEVFNVNVSAKVSEAVLPEGWYAKDIAVSPVGTVWVVVQDAGRTSTLLLRRDFPFAAWTPVMSVAGSVSVASAMSGVWLLNGRRLEQIGDDGSVLRTHMLDFDGVDVCESTDGSLWLIGGEARHGGHPVHRLAHHAKHWRTMPEPVAARRVSCDPHGCAWSVNSKGQVWRLHPDGPGSFSECGQVADCRRCLKSPDAEDLIDLSVGYDGQVWVLTRKLVIGGRLIARLVSGAVRAVDRAGEIGAIAIAAGCRQ